MTGTAADRVVRDERGLSTVELVLTLLVVAILMGAAMSWAASTNRAAQGGVDRALADAEIGTVIEARRSSPRWTRTRW